MSGFDSAFHEQPVNMIGMGTGPVSLPGMNIPHGYIGPDARPCGGIGGYDAAANEAIRLRDAAWNSVPTHNIHEPYKLLDTSTSLPDLAEARSIARMLQRDAERRSSDELMSTSLPDSVAIRYNRYSSGMPQLMEAERDDARIMARILQREAERKASDELMVESAQIQRQRGPLTVFEQTGDSHISHVAGQGFHVTTQVPGIGKNYGLDQPPSFHTIVEVDKRGRLRFDSDY